jgi:glycosyltransferase involved in cell wall biosynthesis
MEDAAADPRLLVIIPAYNEAESIGGVIADLRSHVPGADVVVVDDGSGDATAALAAEAGAAVLRLPFNLGVGGAMRTGYAYARQHGYDVAVQFDGDGQHRADHVAALLAKLRAERADLVVGSRMIGEGTYRFPLARRIGSRWVGRIASLVTRQRLTDPTSGFRAASRRMIEFFARHYPQSYLGDTVEAIVLAARHGMKVREVATEMREASHSSVGTVRGLFHTVCISLAILIDPIEKRFPGYPKSPRSSEEGPP